MLIFLELRDGTVVIPRREIEYIIDVDWFLGILIKKYGNTKNPLNDTGPQDEIRFTLWEGKYAVLSILDSLRYNKLIIYEKNLDYLIALADKWTAPEWIIEQLNERKPHQDKSILDVPVTDKVVANIENKLKQCKICNIGFNILENTPTSCKSHTFSCSVSGGQLVFMCCGFKPDEDGNDDQRYGGCRLGYHIL